jgi:hypothetical protein
MAGEKTQDKVKAPKIGTMVGETSMQVSPASGGVLNGLSEDKKKELEEAIASVLPTLAEGIPMKTRAPITPIVMIVSGGLQIKGPNITVIRRDG